MTFVAPVVVGSPTFGESNGVVMTTLTIPKPSVGVTVQNGDLLVAVLRNGTSAQATDYTLAGWSRRAIAPMPAVTAATRLSGIYAHYVTDATSEPANYVFTLTGNAFARQVGMIFVVRPRTGASPWGADPTLFQSTGWTGGPPGYPSSFTVAPNSLVIYGTGNELVSPGALTWVNPPGSTLIGIHGSMTDQANTAVTRATVMAAWEVVTGTTAGGPGESQTLPSISGSAYLALAIPGTLAPVPAQDGTGATIYVTEWNGTTERNLGELGIWYPGYASVNDLLAATNHPTMAHRGGSLNWPEFSEWAYDHSVMRGYGVLEFSCAWSSDMVPFGNGDQYLDRMVTGVDGTTLDATTMTWATISGTYQNVLRPIAPGTFQPIQRLDTFLTKYTPTHVVCVDPKYGFADAAKIDEMLDICDAHGGPTKIIIKFDSPTTNTVLTSAAHARGYKCMNYWASDGTAMAAQEANWDIIGTNYANAALLAQAQTYGKPVWAAICPDQAAYDTAVVGEADLVMCSNVAGIRPVTYWN